MILAAITFIKGSRLAQLALVAGVVVIIVMVFRFVWLPNHDRAVRAEYMVQLQEQARKDSAKASTAADAQSAKRKEETDEVQDRIANSSSVDDVFSGLRRGSGAK